MPQPPSAPPTLPLSLPDFETALRKGHGRAILTLKCVADTSPYRDAVRRACFTDQRHCRMFESVRGEYVADLALLCTTPALLADEFIEDLVASGPDDDCGILYDVVVALAKRQYPGARAAIRLEIDRTPPLKRVWRGWSMIELFGLDGLLELAENIGNRAPEEDKPWIYGSWMDEASQQLGSEVVVNTLREQALTSAPVAAFLTETLKWIGQEQSPAGAPDATPYVAEPWPEIWQRIVEWSADESSLEPSHRIGWWGRYASDEMLRLPAQQFVTERDPRRLRALRRMFDVRRWPLQIELLLEKINDPDPAIADVAMRLARSTPHPAIRTEALCRLADGRIARNVLDLLMSNYQPGDHLLLEQAFFNADLSDDVIDSLGSSLNVFFNRETGADGERLMRWVYELTPCAFCRSSALDHLISWGCAPRYLIEEALHDAHDETRERAIRALSDEEEPRSV